MYHTIITRILICTLTVFGLTNNGYAQKVDLAALKEQYPKKELIYLSYDVEVRVELKDGELDIKEHRKQSKILLTENAKQFEEESLPYYNANEIIDVSAEVEIPKGNKYRSYKVREFNTIKTISDRYFYDDSYAVQFNLSLIHI